MANQRTQTRHEMATYLEVRDAGSGKTVGHVVDLTTRGMRLVANEPFETTTTYQLLIATDIGPTSVTTIPVTAQCTWAGRDVNPDLLAAGFAFEPLPPREEAALARVIRQHRFEHSR
jgi:hypothetical protein